MLHAFFLVYTSICEAIRFNYCFMIEGEKIQRSSLLIWCFVCCCDAIVCKYNGFSFRFGLCYTFCMPVCMFTTAINIWNNDAKNRHVYNRLCKLHIRQNKSWPNIKKAWYAYLHVRPIVCVSIVNDDKLCKYFLCTVGAYLDIFFLYFLLVILSEWRQITFEFLVVF